MADQPKNPRSLSEISHLFLSAVRDRQTGTAQRPQRKPPQCTPSVSPPPPKDPSIDLTPEELRHVIASEQSSRGPSTPPVRALIASHLGAHQFDAACHYARAAAAGGKRVGLIFIDACEFRLNTFQPGSAEEAEPCEEIACFDLRAMREAVNELNCDLDCWLLAVGNPRLAEARALLRRTHHWTALSTTDQEGAIACYRSLKGLADNQRPRLSLAPLDPKDPADAQAFCRKLAGVCQQFLHWPIKAEPAVVDTENVSECAVMCCRIQHDKAQLAAGVHWQVVEELLVNPRPHEQEHAVAISAPAPVEVEAAVEAQPAVAAPRLAAVETAPVPVNQSCEGALQIIDLPESEDQEQPVLAAYLKHSSGQLVECPVRPSLCTAARLAVTRERRLVLLAAAGSGLQNLKSIGQAYRWVVENIQLLGMAMPQFALDPQAAPLLRLLVDHADLDAEAFTPIFQVQTVTIQSYRRVRWGLRVGLLLEAA